MFERQLPIPGHDLQQLIDEGQRLLEPSRRQQGILELRLNPAQSGGDVACVLEGSDGLRKLPIRPSACPLVPSSHPFSGSSVNAWFNAASASSY